MKICLVCGNRFEADDFCCPACGHSPEVRDGNPTFAPELAADYDGFKAGFFASLAELEAGNFWFESRNRLLTWTLGRYFPKVETFLEIGCGTGFVLSGIRREFQDIKLFGSDIFSEGFAYAKDRVPEAKFFQMDARNIPFVSEFDVVGAFDVIEHIDEDKTVLKQIYRALKPDGVLLLTVPQHRWLWSSVDEYSCHIRRYTARELHEKVKIAGFTIVRSTSFVASLLPFMLISRLLQRGKSESFVPQAESRIHPILNRIFEGFLRLELWLIRMGVSFPVGGSRLVVAKK